MTILEIVSQPWPWYIAGPLVVLTVPTLLLLGNKNFGISANLRYACAACMHEKIPFFTYDWRKEVWNIFFVLGILLGGVIASTLFSDPNAIVIDSRLQTELSGYGITTVSGMLPEQLFS
jgi:uncharacterized membrane protein YedE/YeeE